MSEAEALKTRRLLTTVGLAAFGQFHPPTLLGVGQAAQQYVTSTESGSVAELRYIQTVLLKWQHLLTHSREE